MHESKTDQTNAIYPYCAEPVARKMHHHYHHHHHRHRRHYYSTYLSKGAVPMILIITYIYSYVQRKAGSDAG